MEKENTLFQTAYANYFHCTIVIGNTVFACTARFKPLTRIIFTALMDLAWLKLIKSICFKPLTRIIFTALVFFLFVSLLGLTRFKPLTRIIFTAQLFLEIADRDNYRKRFKPLTRIIFTAHW